MVNWRLYFFPNINNVIWKKYYTNNVKILYTKWVKYRKSALFAKQQVSYLLSGEKIQFYFMIEKKRYVYKTLAFLHIYFYSYLYKNKGCKTCFWCLLSLIPKASSENQEYKSTTVFVRSLSKADGFRILIFAKAEDKNTKKVREKCLAPCTIFSVEKFYSPFACFKEFWFFQELNLMFNFTNYFKLQKFTRRRKFI